jgi:hypothetical protein
VDDRFQFIGDIEEEIHKGKLVLGLRGGRKTALKACEEYK